MTNNELRRRKVNKEHNEKNGPVRPIRRRKDNMHTLTFQRPFLCSILSGTILLVFYVYYGDVIPWHMAHRAVDQVANQLGHHVPVYAVVLDAGSTGSRVLAFTFHVSYIGNYLILDKELFKYTKPGLSSFVDDPAKAVESISKLLEMAKAEIPNEYWSKTPLILKATAGLRLLPFEKAENLLKSIRNLFDSTPFVTDPNSVEIMNGTDEGIFSWFTVNFLLGRINGDPARTVAALDLGGASTQVTFSAVTPASLSQKQYIHKAKSPNGLIPVYTQSYLGLGLMAARAAIISIDYPETETEVTSECINHIVTHRKFHFAGLNYYVSGPKTNYSVSNQLGASFLAGQEMPIVNFTRCSKLVTDYVMSVAQAPEELPLKVVFAFSYYFDRAAEVGLIDETTGGKVQIKDFKDAAETNCHTSNADQPFMCLDLTFIWILLEKGLGLDPATDIYLYKKIDGHEISWALGAAYDLLRG